MLNPEQKKAYDIIIDRIHNNKVGAFFVDGPEGTGKTFIYRALLATIRSTGNITLATTTSGVAASILLGGRTTHSRFKIPIKNSDSNNCNISKQSSTAKLIKEAKLIIWDEATMAKNYAIHCFNKLLKDIMESEQPFGGKVVVFGGDFRQTLPVVRKGQKEDYISASLVASDLWQELEQLKLISNMRARLDPTFTQYLLQIGNGEGTTNENCQVVLPSTFIIPYIDETISINSLITAVFPNLHLFESNSESITNRAILTTRNEFVNEINNIIISTFPGHEKNYISADKAINNFQQADYEDFFQTFNPPSLPPHILTLKKNCPVMLLRNLNPAEGLCNGTRLICLNFCDYVIHAKIAFGNLAGKEVFIPRIPLQCSNDDTCVIPFKRLQFPIRLCFALTINKAQGQTLDFIGLYLKEPVFSHGQLYVALSRAKTSQNVKILIKPTQNQQENYNTTRNIVYKEVLIAAGII